jgi:DNA-binding response OmpR family regulator
VLEKLPVAILSSSPMDVIRGRMSGANVSADCYFVKPMNVDEFVGLGRDLRRCYEHSLGTDSMSTGAGS